MIKLVTLLTIVAVVLTLILVNKGASNPQSVLTPSPTLSPVSTTSATLGDSTDSAQPESWETYFNNSLSLKFSHPKSVIVKTLTDGSLQISKEKLDIRVSTHKFSDKDTLNTVAEQILNGKMNSLKDKFLLSEPISPIAIGSQTGITFGTLEAGTPLTYYYLAATGNYLEIVDHTPVTSGGGEVSLSESIIYSMEVIPH